MLCCCCQGQEAGSVSVAANAIQCLCRGVVGGIMRRAARDGLGKKKKKDEQRKSKSTVPPEDKRIDDKKGRQVRLRSEG